MIGLRVGVKVGPRVGIAAGISEDEMAAATGATMAGVARDATSNIYLPANATQWTSTMAVASIGSGNPSALHLMQEASGNLADSIGAFTLTAGGTLLYQQTVPGWSAKGIKTATGVSGIMQSSSASLPDIHTTSMLALLYVLLPAATAATRSYVTFGPAFGSQVACNMITGVRKAQCLDDPNTANGASDAVSQVRPLLLQINRTGNVVELCTNLERLTPTFSGTPTGKAYILGGDNSQTNFPDTADFIYSAVFFGGSADLTVAQKRTLLQTLGWSPVW